MDTEELSRGLSGSIVRALVQLPDFAGQESLKENFIYIPEDYGRNDTPQNVPAYNRHRQALIALWG